MNTRSLRNRLCDLERSSTSRAFICVFKRDGETNEEAIDRAAAKRVADRVKRTGQNADFSCDAKSILSDFAKDKKEYVMAQHLTARRNFERSTGSRKNEASYSEEALKHFNDSWEDFATQMSLIPGKLSPKLLPKLKIMNFGNFHVICGSQSSSDKLILGDLLYP